MSNKSKRARKKRKKRRAPSSTGGSQRTKHSQSNQSSTPSSILSSWWIIAAAAVAVLLIGAALWFAVGPGKPVSPSPTAEPVDMSSSLVTQTPLPTQSEKKESLSMPTDPALRNNMYDSPPAMEIDPDRTYVATIETEKGDIIVELFAAQVPTIVNNFVFLARQGFYDNTTFHRVIPNFMAQAGDPTGTGRGGPGYRFEDEFHSDLKHDRPGVLSMANSGANTNGSQFFITLVPTSWLDAYDAQGNLKDCSRPDVSCHAVFGQVTEGLDVLNSISVRDPGQATSPGDLIKTIRIDES